MSNVQQTLIISGNVMSNEGMSKESISEQSIANEHGESATEVIIPKWFVIVAILAFVWNLMGVMAFVDQMMMTPERIAELSAAEQELFVSIPPWAVIAFAIAVFGGALGALALMLKKPVATYILMTSLLAVLVQMFHSFFIIDSFAVYGSGGLIMPVIVVVIAILLVKLSIKAQRNHWLT